MTHPEFFDAVPKIVLFDPLAQLLGAFKGGVIEMKYAEVVKAAGHSCPTVAGAYLMTAKALKQLYPESLPVRGEVSVEFGQSIEEGTVGVVGSVVAHLTGAAGPGGFKGIGGEFARRDLMQFARPMSHTMRCTRADTGKSIDVASNPDVVPAVPESMSLLKKILSNSADADDKRAFAHLWQDRVKRMLIDHWHDPLLTVVK